MNERLKREKLGRRAETLAAFYLRLKGYTIVARRFKTPSGEIDIIAARRDLVIMIEVKAREHLQIARESISMKSRKRVETAARQFLSRQARYQNYGIRFDAIFVIKGRKIVHEKDFWRTN
ncbi:MAG: YraN family protein [Hellea sp.]|nr:YraN family protein [Hellea sp.]